VTHSPAFVELSRHMADYSTNAEGGGATGSLRTGATRGDSPMQALPTGTVTFLFTDLEGSTRLWEEQPSAMALALPRHDAILRRAVESHDGAVVKSTGDGVHAVFVAAPDAVAAAIDAQLELGREPWPDGLHIRVRMGIHTGEAELRDGDYYGTTTNRAA